MARKRSEHMTIQKKQKTEIMELVKRAEQGEQTALAGIREMFDREPSLCNALGDLARLAEESLITVITVASGDNPLTKESLQYKLRGLKEELAGPSPTPVERMLVERVTACWLQLYYFETLYAQGLDGGVTQQWSEYHQRRIDRAQRRYLSAIKALVQVRRLLGPMVQLNIAEKQINVARSTT